MGIILVVLTFLTAASSGFFVLIMGIVPIAVCIIVETLYEQKIGRAAYTILVELLVTIAGLFVCRINNVNPLGDSFSIISKDEFWDSLSQLITEFINVVAPFGPEKAAVLSASGILTVLKLCIIFFVCIFGLIEIRSTCGIDLITKQADSDVARVKRYLMTVTVFVALIQFLTVARSRYWIMGFVPIVLIATINWCQICTKNNELIQIIGKCAVAGVACLISILMLRFGIKYYFDDNANWYAIADCMKELNVNMALTADGPELAECMRVIDYDCEYIGVDSDNQLVVYDWYIDQIEKFDYADRNAIVASKVLVEEQGDKYIPQEYVYVKTVGDYNIYINETAR